MKYNEKHSKAIEISQGKHMERPLSVAERRQIILERLSASGHVAVGALSEEFGVSEVTIRADLQALAEGNLLFRVHGGAIPPTSVLQVLSLALRRQPQVVEKGRIGAAAAALVADGDAIVLDSSSTALTIAQFLKRCRYLTVITNSLPVAQELLDAPDVTVVMPGGILRRDTASLLGAEGLALLGKLNLQRGFFGAHGITVREGLTDVSAAEAEVKRPLVEMCREVVAVLDATKWGRVGVASFAELPTIHKVITDEHAPAHLVQQVRTAGVEVILV
jgi:DeoR family transcriptional regulator of aga operon/DeoR family fructose operon transcriptional repressor